MDKQTLERVPLAGIILRPQVRRTLDNDAVTGLAESIRSVGLQQPPLCRRSAEGLVVVDGERRVRACRLLGWTDIPVLVMDGMAENAEVLARQLVANLQREDLNPLERAEGIQSLMKLGSLTAEQAAQRLGMSSAAVTRSLAILRLPDEVRSRVAEGTVAADTAYQLSRVADPSRQAELAQQAASGKLTRDALAKAMRKRPDSPPSKGGVRRIALAAGANRSILLAGHGWDRDLTLDGLIECLDAFVTRARKASRQGLSLSTFVRTLKDQASA